MVHINYIAENGLPGDGLPGMTVLWMLMLKKPRELDFLRLLIRLLLGVAFLHTLGFYYTLLQH